MIDKEASVAKDNNTKTSAQADAMETDEEL